MGAGLVAAALSPEWASRLTSTEQLVLVAMSLTARDTTSIGIVGGQWWAGIETLMAQTDGVVHERGSKEWATAERRILRAMKRLTEVGAITRKHAATARRRAVWEITTASLQLPEPVDKPVGNIVESMLTTGSRARSA